MCRAGFLLAALLACPGCASRTARPVAAATLRHVIDHYAQQQSSKTLAETRARPVAAGGVRAAPDADSPRRAIDSPGAIAWVSDHTAQSAESQPAAAIPADYWKGNVLDQASAETVELFRRGLWHDYRVAFWDAENLMALTGAMGASVAIRGAGVDDTVRRRIHGHRQLGDADETLQLIGNPATHFAAAGALWLGSAIAEDAKSHELARTLGEALIVNGVTVSMLKVSANTRDPAGNRYAWPSGHTSSAFTVAAVLNEDYGPWVGIPALSLAGLVGYQRLDSRQHDLSDVVFGGVMGYVVGSSIARDGKARFPEIWGMQVVPYSDPETGAAGLALWKRF